MRETEQKPTKELLTRTKLQCFLNKVPVSTASASKAGDVMMISASQKEGILKKNSILPNKDPPEGKTKAIVAVMRGKI
jgi:hypothetical protein